VLSDIPLEIPLPVPLSFLRLQNLEAYPLYFQGRFFWEKFSPARRRQLSQIAAESVGEHSYFKAAA